MKLAREIVEKAVEGTNSLAPYGYVLIEESDLESLTAAKLERIREAVELGLGIAKEHDGEWDYIDEVRILKSALAMLSEENGAGDGY